MLQQEIENLQQTFRILKEEIAEKEGQIKLITINFNTSEKQKIHLKEEVIYIPQTISFSFHIF